MHLFAFNWRFRIIVIDTPFGFKAVEVFVWLLIFIYIVLESYMNKIIPKSRAHIITSRDLGVPILVGDFGVDIMPRLEFNTLCIIYRGESEPPYRRRGGRGGMRGRGRGARRGGYHSEREGSVGKSTQPT